MTVEEQIRVFVETELLDSMDSLGVDEALLGEGRVDSIGALRLAAFIEEAFGVEISPEDFVVENFETVGTVAAFVRGRRPSVDNESVEQM